MPGGGGGGGHGVGGGEGGGGGHVPPHQVQCRGRHAFTYRVITVNCSEEAGHRAELQDTWVWFQSGLNTDGAHNPLTSRRVQHGDILSLNCFPMIQGQYYDGFTRPPIRYSKKKTT